MATTWVIATVSAVTILIWNRTFVGLWVGDEYFAGQVPVLLLMVAAIQLALIRNDAFIIDLTLDVKAKVLVGLGSAVVSLVLAGILVGPMDLGIAGLCAGLLVGRAVLSVLYPWADRSDRAPSFGGAGPKAVRPFAATVLLLAVATPLEVITPAAGCCSSSERGFTGLLAVPLTALVGLRAEERLALVRRARLLVGVREAPAPRPDRAHRPPRRARCTDGPEDRQEPHPLRRPARRRGNRVVGRRTPDRALAPPVPAGDVRVPVLRPVELLSATHPIEAITQFAQFGFVLVVELPVLLSTITNGGSST